MLNTEGTQIKNPQPWQIPLIITSLKLWMSVLLT
jgi:hypothetical protein